MCWFPSEINPFPTRWGGPSFDPTSTLKRYQNPNTFPIVVLTTHSLPNAQRIPCLEVCLTPLSKEFGGGASECGFYADRFVEETRHFNTLKLCQEPRYCRKHLEYMNLESFWIGQWLNSWIYSWIVFLLIFDVNTCDFSTDKLLFLGGIKFEGSAPDSWRGGVEKRDPRIHWQNMKHKTRIEGNKGEQNTPQFWGSFFLVWKVLMHFLKDFGLIEFGSSQLFVWRYDHDSWRPLGFWKQLTGSPSHGYEVPNRSVHWVNLWHVSTDIICWIIVENPQKMVWMSSFQVLNCHW